MFRRRDFTELKAGAPAKRLERHSERRQKADPSAEAAS
jgi:hypothetical protein